MNFVILSIFLIVIIVVLAIILTLGIKRLLRRFHIEKLSYVVWLAIFMMMCTLSMTIVSFITPAMQIWIATPIVQTGLDEQCPALDLDASEGEFTFSSLRQWTSNEADVVCQFSDDEAWCNC